MKSKIICGICEKNIPATEEFFSVIVRSVKLYDKGTGHHPVHHVIKNVFIGSVCSACYPEHLKVLG